MDIDIIIGDKSLTISLENAHRFDLAKLMENVINFGQVEYKKNEVECQEK